MHAANEDAAALPALFAQETVAVARSTFVDEPVGVEPTSGWLEVSSKVIENPPMVDGYNLSYLRDDATAAAYTRDDYEAPLVAFWNRGGGRVAAVSFPLGGDVLAVFLVVFLFEALMTRVGWHLPSFELPRRAEIWSVDSSRAVAAAESMPREQEPRESVAPEPKTASADERRKRFERAKRGR